MWLALWLVATLGSCTTATVILLREYGSPTSDTLLSFAKCEGHSTSHAQSHCRLTQFTLQSNLHARQLVMHADAAGSPSVDGRDPITDLSGRRVQRDRQLRL